MNRRTLIASAAALAAARPARAARDPAAPFIGEWGGVLPVGAKGLRLKLVVARENGTLTAALHSLDQGPEPFAADRVEVSGGKLKARYPKIRARLELAAPAPDRLEGSFTQGATLPLALARDPDFAALENPLVIAPLTAARLATLRAQAGSPALAAAARHAGGASLTLVTGRRAAGEAAPAAENDLWHMGSITKSMTAVLIARLVEAGAIAWEDTVGATLGEAAPQMRPDYRELTYLHLLSHRGGLQANLPLPEILKLPRREADARASRRRYAQIALAQAPAGPKEKTFLYANSGYVIAGAMLEQKLGASWETLIAERVFTPLGLASAGFGPPGGAAPLDQPYGHAKAFLSWGANPRRQAYPPTGRVADNPAALGPAGTVHMTLADLLAFGAAHRDRADVLGPASWDRLHAPPFGGDYALGLVRQEGGLWHNGSNTLWYAELFIDPAKGVVSAAVANDGHLAKSQFAVERARLGAARAVGG